MPELEVGFSKSRMGRDATQIFQYPLVQVRVRPLLGVLEVESSRAQTPR